jgi:diazepam-binding inhibitor (GABA receptor modulating acyl-CoA-binding protein)
MEINPLFTQAVADSEKLSERPSNETLLKLYALYKQSTVGDVNVDPPSNPFDFVSKAKYEAWVDLKGRATTEAQTEYIELINKLKG